MPIDRLYLITEFNREKRLSYLTALKTEEPDFADETDVYLRLHEFRYVKNKSGFSDIFMRFWLELIFHSDRLNSSSGIASGKKTALNFLNNEKLREIIKTEEQRNSVLYDELLNSILLYFKTCSSDSNYNSHAFGLVKLGNEALVNKIEKQAYKISVEFPEKTGLKEEFSLVTKAVSEGFEIFMKKSSFI